MTADEAGVGAMRVGFSKARLGRRGGEVGRKGWVPGEEPAVEVAEGGDWLVVLLVVVGGLWRVAGAEGGGGREVLECWRLSWEAGLVGLGYEKGGRRRGGEGRRNCGKGVTYSDLLDALGQLALPSCVFWREQGG